MSNGDREGYVTITRREPIEEKVCPICGRTFTGLRRRRYCSQACMAKASYDRHAEKRRAERRERYQQQKEQEHSE